MADRVETIGIYSAYGFAKEAGYTGTKAEFEQGLKNSAEYADNAASSANAATNAKNAAVTAKTDAQAAQSAAETAQGLAEDAQAAAEEAKNDAEAAAASLDASTIARIDGFYENMGVGTADQLMASQKVHNSDPYIFWTSGGTSDIGNREELEIVGGSVVWNQSVRDLYINTSNGIEREDVSVGNKKAVRVHGECTKTDTYTVGLLFSNFSRNGHTFLHTLNCTLPSDCKIGASSRWGTSEGVTKNESPVYLDIKSGAVVDFVVYPQLFDLTAMFGSEIADHIYELEQAEAGAGVAWFRKYFPNDYYDHNPGELMHVSDLQSHDTVGFNLWDEEWEVGQYSIVNGTKSTATGTRCKNPISVIGGTDYYFHCASRTGSNNFGICWYDSNDSFISSNVTYGKVTAPVNAKYLRFFAPDGWYGSVYNNDICINLSWSGTHDGEYEPYVKHSYPLDSSLTLRGIPKLTADGDLTYDGDVYKPDGTVERRYGIVTLNGSESWTVNSANSGLYYITLSGSDGLKSNGKTFSNKFISTSAVGSEMTDGQMKTASTNINFKTSYATLEEWKAALALNPVIVVYELATPTTEEAEPYTSPQIVDDWGTEEFVTTSIVPVGHNTSYPANLRDKLQHLPDLPDDDGYYMTQVTGTQMSLVRFRIPQAPAEDGEYILKATVSNGTPTYNWEAVVEAEGGEG